MSARPSSRPARSRSTSGAFAVWTIALLVALVATIQLRSQAEVERSLQDAVNNLEAGGGEAMEVNLHRVVEGVVINQGDNGVTIDGSVLQAPWVFAVIGDPTRLGETADEMTRQLRGDRRVREAAYRVE